MGRKKKVGEKIPQDVTTIGRSVGELSSFSQFSVFYGVVMFLMQQHEKEIKEVHSI